MKSKNFLLLIVAIFLFHPLFAQIQIGSSISGLVAGDEFGGGSLDDVFGNPRTTAISGDGQRIAVASPQHDGNGMDAGQVRIFEFDQGDWVQLGQDLNGRLAGDYFGNCIELSFDGSVIVVGASTDSLSGTRYGYTKVYELNQGTWMQLGSTIEGSEDTFQEGYAVSISDDGKRIATGHPFSLNNGGVRVYDIIQGDWIQVGTSIGNFFSGISISLSGDGNVIAIGSLFGESLFNAGKANIYRFDQNDWVAVGIDIVGTSENLFGYDLSMSETGNRVAILGTGNASIYEIAQDTLVQLGNSVGSFAVNSVSLSDDGNRVAIGGASSSVNPMNGQVMMYDWDGANWRQVCSDIIYEEPDDRFGFSVSIAGDGNSVVASAPLHDSNGVDAGQVRVFDIRNECQIIDLQADDNCLILGVDTDPDNFVIKGDFNNYSIFILDENENVVQQLTNVQSPVNIDLSALPAGLHYIKIINIADPDLCLQHVIKN